MTEVHILHHVMREFANDEDVKLVGVYSTDEHARAAILRLSDQPGFQDNPEGFKVECYPLDKDHWNEGFVTVVTNAQN